jgi:hypothetical protein
MRGAVLWMGFLFEFPKFCMQRPSVLILAIVLLAMHTLPASVG